MYYLNYAVVSHDASDGMKDFLEKHLPLLSDEQKRTVLTSKIKAMCDIREDIQSKKAPAQLTGRIMMALAAALSSTTCYFTANGSDLIIDGTVSTGRGATSVHYALYDRSVYCAKVGPEITLKSEWTVWSTLKSRFADVPTITPIIANAALFKDRCALVLPLYSMTLSDAVLSFPAEDSQATVRMRGDLACGVAFSVLSAIMCFSLSGLAHCDIKPKNIMFTTGSQVLTVIDYGSAMKASTDSLLWEYTPSVGLDAVTCPCAEYDLTCLAFTLFFVLGYPREVSVFNLSREQMTEFVSGKLSSAGLPPRLATHAVVPYLQDWFRYHQ
jgi:hypothetical protein